VERFNTTIKSAGDISRRVHLPTLGVIPEASVKNRRRLYTRKNQKAKKSVTASAQGELSPRTNGNGNGNFLPMGIDESHDKLVVWGDQSSIAEAYRALRTSVLLSTAGSPPKIMLITSGQPGDGKTTTVVNTAISLAQLGSSVLIIDADLRKPAAHKSFNLNQTVGLSTFLSREAAVDSLIRKLPVPNLSLLPCGPIPPNPAELISSEKMKTLLKDLSLRYDHILIDSPPLMYVTDPVILSTMVDGVMLVVRSGKSTREIARQAHLKLSSVGARVFGVVLNRVNPRDTGYDQSGYYPYFYEYGKESAEKSVSDLFS
jgi:capsular exopolysaccharide synthesis family protein